MNNDVLLEMMASVLQSIYDEGYGSEFRPAMQNVLVMYNNSGLTKRAIDEGDSPASEHSSTLPLEVLAKGIY